MTHLRRYFIKQSSYFSIYAILQIFIHLILISIVAFFHFLLKHKMGVIEEWIFDRAWEIIIITKVISFSVMMKFLEVKSDSRHFFRDLIQSGLKFPPRQIWVLIINFFLIFIWLGKPVRSENVDFSTYRFLLSFLGIFIFFIADFFIVQVIQFLYPINRWSGLARNLLFSLVVTFLGILLFSDHKTSLFILGNNSILEQKAMGSSLAVWIFFNSFISLFLGFWKEKSWVYPVAYLVFFTCPFASIFGVDFIWSDEFSIYHLKSLASPLELISMLILFLVYLFFSRQRATTRKTI